MASERGQNQGRGRSGYIGITATYNSKKGVGDRTIDPSFFMNYEREIIRILTEAGRGGLSVHKISMHVYNARNSLFDVADIDEVSRRVYNYLLRNSKTPDSVIERAGKRGVYRLNLSSGRTSQLMLKFADSVSEDETENDGDHVAGPDGSLPLFPF